MIILQGVYRLGMNTDEMMQRDAALYAAIGHRLRVAAVDARLTQARLAERAGVSVPTCGKHMRGSSITVGHLARYAAALGVHVTDLLPDAFDDLAAA